MVTVRDLTGDEEQVFEEEQDVRAAPRCNLKVPVPGVNTDAKFQSYIDAEQKELQPTNITPAKMRARLNAPLPDRAGADDWSATIERVPEDEATIFGWTKKLLQGPKMQAALANMRAVRGDAASTSKDAMDLTDKQLAKLSGHLLSLQVIVFEATDSCPTLKLGEYQGLTPDRPGTRSYMDTRVFSAAAHLLAFGSNVPEGHRIFFLDFGTQTLLMDQEVTNGRLLRGLQVSYSHPHPHPHPHPPPPPNPHPLPRPPPRPHPHSHQHRTFTSSLALASTV